MYHPLCMHTTGGGDEGPIHQAVQAFWFYHVQDRGSSTSSMPGDTQHRQSHCKWLLIQSSLTYLTSSQIQMTQLLPSQHVSTSNGAWLHQVQQRMYVYPECVRYVLGQGEESSRHMYGMEEELKHILPYFVIFCHAIRRGIAKAVPS